MRYKCSKCGEVVPKEDIDIHIMKRHQGYCSIKDYGGFGMSGDGKFITFFPISQKDVKRLEKWESKVSCAGVLMMAMIDSGY